jgi:hypothetical protein
MSTQSPQDMERIANEYQALASKVKKIPTYNNEVIEMALKEMSSLSAQLGVMMLGVILLTQIEMQDDLE